VVDSGGSVFDTGFCCSKFAKDCRYFVAGP
jgi:hypothetical protein